MARIRTIKPEFWTSGQVIECSPIARLLFIGLWNFCDDAGRHSSNVRRIKAEVFPGDDFSAETVRGMLDELIKNSLILEYNVDGEGFFQVTGWHHQKIDKPQKPKFPGPNGSHSPNVTRTVDEHSTEDRNTYRKGRERKGKDQKEEVAADAASTSGKGFAFECGVIRLTEIHLERWRRTFPNLSLESELTGLSFWAEKQPSWFMAVEGALAKRQRAIKLELDKAKQENGKPDQPHGALI